jgi:hypothetical protein
LIAWNEAALEQIFEPRELLFGVARRGAVAREHRLGLPQRRLEGPRVDREQQLPFADLLPFGEQDGAQLTGDLRAHLHGRQWLGSTDRWDGYRDGPLFDLCGDDRDRTAAASPPAAASRAPAAAGSARRRGRRSRIGPFLPRTGHERQTDKG